MANLFELEGENEEDNDERIKPHHSCCYPVFTCLSQSEHGPHQLPRQGNHHQVLVMMFSNQPFHKTELTFFQDILYRKTESGLPRNLSG